MRSITPLAEGLWAVAAPLSVYGLRLGSRTTLARLSGGGLLAYSPVPLSAELAGEIAELGSVEVVVAPSKVHHLHVAEWMRAFPDASLYGAPGLSAKRKDLAFRGVLGDEPEITWRSEFDQALVRGAPLMNEVVFLHRASRTLVVTDIAFNVSQVAHAWTRTYLRAMGALGGFRQSRMVKLCVRDRKAVCESIERIVSWDFERIVVTHGDVLERGGPRALEQVFAWL